MPPKREHPAKGWAGTCDRTSLVRTDIRQDTSDNQQRLNRDTARAYGLRTKPGYIFSEPGVPAGKPIPRPVIERGIRAVVQEKAIEALILASVDRLSRLGMRHVGEMLDAVDAVGGRVIFSRQNLDSSRPANRAIIAFLAEQAKDEHETLSWRIETWREGCRIKGKWVGRHPYGYQVIDGRLVPHPVEAPIVRRIVTDFLDGIPARQIAVTLNEEETPAPAASKAEQMRAQGREPKQGKSAWWSTRAVTRLLRNAALVGWAVHNGQVVLGPDGEPVSFGEGILTPGEYARVLAELERRTTLVRQSPTKTREVGKKTGGGRPPSQLLVGTIRCSGCNYAMAVSSNKPNVDWRGRSYGCGAAGGGRNCPAPAYIKVEKADEEVMRQLRLRLGALEPGDPILDAIAERYRELTMPEGEGERAVLQSRLEAVRARIVDLDEARYVRGEFSTPDDIARWNHMMERLKLQRDAVAQELDELGPPPDFDLASLRATYSEEVWDGMPLPQRRKWLQVAVAMVFVTSSKGRKPAAADRVRVVLIGEEPQDGE
jgi:DNA invertase Pin-like site-specific DNA recombinase